MKEWAKALRQRRWWETPSGSWPQTVFNCIGAMGMVAEYKIGRHFKQAVMLDTD